MRLPDGTPMRMQSALLLGAVGIAFIWAGIADRSPFHVWRQWFTS